MTTLDEKALKAAKAVEGMPTEYVIRAYLDALPPAQRKFAWILGSDDGESLDLLSDPLFYDTREAAEWGAVPNSRVTEVEIREIRS